MLHVRVLESSLSAETAIFVYRETEKGIMVFKPSFVNQETGQVSYGWYEYEDGFDPGDFEPTFRLPRSLARQGLLQMIVDEIAETTGVMPKKLQPVPEVLEAKDEHLSDLRRVLFESDYVNVERGAPLVEIPTPPRPKKEG